MLLNFLLNFSAITKLLDSNRDKTFWIGLTDIKTKERWLFDSNSQEANFNKMMFQWGPNEPNNNRNHNERCVHIWWENTGWFLSSDWKYTLNDLPCAYKENLGKPIHGLCEIKGNHCSYKKKLFL